MPVAEIELPAHPRYVAQARRFVRDTLALWRCDDLILATELVVSELVSNGVLHARSPLRLTVSFENDAVTVEVSDDSPTVPVRRYYSDDATTGRGLGLVAELSNGEWGSRTRPGGKTVWARVRAAAGGGGHIAGIQVEPESGWLSAADPSSLRGPVVLAA